MLDQDKYKDAYDKVNGTTTEIPPVQELPSDDAVQEYRKAFDNPGLHKSDVSEPEKKEDDIPPQ